MELFACGLNEWATLKTPAACVRYSMKSNPCDHNDKGNSSTMPVCPLTMLRLERIRCGSNVRVLFSNFEFTLLEVDGELHLLGKRAKNNDQVLPKLGNTQQAVALGVKVEGAVITDSGIGLLKALRNGEIAYEQAPDGGKPRQISHVAVGDHGSVCVVAADPGTPTKGGLNSSRVLHGFKSWKDMLAWLYSEENAGPGFTANLPSPVTQLVANMTDFTVLLSSGEVYSYACSAVVALCSLTTYEPSPLANGQSTTIDPEDMPPEEMPPDNTPPIHIIPSLQTHSSGGTLTPPGSHSPEETPIPDTPAIDDGPEVGFLLDDDDHDPELASLLEDEDGLPPVVHTHQANPESSALQFPSTSESPVLIRKLSAAGNTTAALSTTNALYLWTSDSSPPQILDLQNPSPSLPGLASITDPSSGQPLLIADVAVGQSHVVVVGTDGETVMAAGEGVSGQLGIGTKQFGFCVDTGRGFDERALEYVEDWQVMDTASLNLGGDRKVHSLGCGPACTFVTVATCP